MHGEQLRNLFEFGPSNPEKLELDFIAEVYSFDADDKITVILRHLENYNPERVAQIPLSNLPDWRDKLEKSSMFYCRLSTKPAKDVFALHSFNFIEPEQLNLPIEIPDWVRQLDKL